MDAYIPLVFGSGKQSANVNPGAFDANNDSWEKVKLFRYGALSFLLPRLLVLGVNPDGNGDIKESPSTPKLSLFNKAMWNYYNMGKVKSGKFDKESFMKQSERETISCGRFLPNLERRVYGGKSDILGVNTVESDQGYPKFAVYEELVLGRMSLYDGWVRDYDKRDNELYYYSAPPYQSYRVWSAGPDGKTFPPWIPLESLTVEQRKKVSAWISDDVARFDH